MNLYIFYVLCMYLNHALFHWCWLKCFAYKVFNTSHANFSSFCNGELKDSLCFVLKSSPFFPSFSDKTTSSCSVQTFTLASGLQGNWVSLCDFTQKKIVFVKYTTCRIKYSFKCHVFLTCTVYLSSKKLGSVMLFFNRKIITHFNKFSVLFGNIGCTNKGCYLV